MVEERVEKKLSDIDQVVIEGVKKKFQEQKRAERARKLELLREIAAKQAELLQTVNVEHYNSLTHFILTKAEPRVFWLPREHTEATLTMVEESAAEMRAKGQTIVIEPEPVDEKQLAQMDAEAEDGDHQHTANGHGGDAESKSAAQNSNDNTGAGGAESPARDGDNHANAHPAEDADGAAGDTAKVDEDAMEM